MKAGDIIEALERFFLDIIGTILPGLALLLGVCYVARIKVADLSRPFSEKPDDYSWVLLIALSYILGHAVRSMGHKLASASRIFIVATRSEEH